MKKITYLFLFLIILFTVGAIVSSAFFNKTLNPKAVKEKLDTFGFWSPAIIMAIMFLICFISIVPSAPFVITMGYMVGPFLGTIYTVIAVVFGVSIVFILSRVYGRPFVEKVVNKKDLAKADIFFQKWGVGALIVERFIPLFPENIVSVSIGLTKMKYRVFILISLPTIIAGAIMQTYVGSLLSNTDLQIPLSKLLTAFSLFFAFLLITLFLFRKKIKKWIERETEVVAEEVEALEGLEKKEAKKIKAFEKKEIEKVKTFEEKFKRKKRS